MRRTRIWASEHPMKELKATALNFHSLPPFLPPIQATHGRSRVGQIQFSGSSLKTRISQLACLAESPSRLVLGRKSRCRAFRTFVGGTRVPSRSIISLRCDLNLSNLGIRSLGWTDADFRIPRHVSGVSTPSGFAAMTVPTASETVVVRGHTQDCSPRSASAELDCHNSDSTRSEDGSSHPSKLSSPAGVNGMTDQCIFPNGGQSKPHASPGNLGSAILNNWAWQMGGGRGEEVGHVSTLERTEAELRSGASGGRSLDVNKVNDGEEQAQESAKRLRMEDRDLRGYTYGRSDDIGGRISKAWEHWKRLGEPKFLVAPMVDQSELPFRMLCRKYGATAAYTPMLHSRLFAQDGKYRATEFSTCAADRPLFVQFCANNPDTLLDAARLVESQCDYVDINLGCPQRIAKKGNYGAFLMDNQPLIKSLVSKLASNLTTPVSCKIRVYPDLEKTLAYARMIEEAGCSLLAVHGRTRDQKNGREIRADWDAIKAVKAAVRIPVLANGNIRWLEDVHACIEYTGVDGVLSAESLLENPALFGGYRTALSIENGSVDETLIGAESHSTIDELSLLQEYLQLCEQYPVPMRMVRGHVHKLLGRVWFKRNPDIREELNKQHRLTIDWLKNMVTKLVARRSDLSFEDRKAEKYVEEVVLQAA